MEQMRGSKSRLTSATRREGARKSAAQQQYRHELEQQIREKEMQKAVQRQREAEDSYPSTPSHKVFPWENTIGRIAGGGGDPVRDRMGNVVTDLREALTESVGRDREQWLREMKEEEALRSPMRAPANREEEWWERADRKAGRPPSSQPMSPAGGYSRQHSGGRGREEPRGTPLSRQPSGAGRTGMSPQTPPPLGGQPHYAADAEPQYHAHHPHHRQPQPHASSPRITRMDSLKAEGDGAVITFSKGARVSTFNVPGMAVEEFEAMLHAWSAEQGSPAHHPHH
mmetsp:Transcript_22215/g.56932  ORF Transcript_22215/g.56932 Transcript_22215/m.56932 type:complete len:283 (-) Transcript_22215:29-877(-)